MLKTMEKLLEGQLIGPESIVVENSNILYTCTADGKCVKIVDGKIQKILPLTEHTNCADLTRHTMVYCGRPLGIRRYDADHFVVIDSMLGIFRVDFEKGTNELLLPSRINNLVFPDDFDFVDNDTVVFSDASSRFGQTDFALAILEHVGDGRLMEYKISTGALRVLVGGLNFPNGVQMHPDKQSVLFCESGSAQVQRYYLAGPKKGRSEIFAGNLPGYPDNIRLSASGRSFFVALFGHRSAQHPCRIFESMGPYPMLRKIVGMLPSSVGYMMFSKGHHRHGIVLEFDLNGKLLGSLHDTTGQVINDISQISDDGDKYLYLASFANNYIGRISKE